MNCVLHSTEPQQMEISIFRSQLDQSYQRQSGVSRFDTKTDPTCRHLVFINGRVV